MSCPEPVHVTGRGLATHLYHIAHEAVNNALKHGEPEHDRLTLGRENGTGTLTVEDDGIGSPVASGHPGLGLAHHELSGQHGRRLAGSTPRRHGGTQVCCRFPLQR